MDLDRPAKAGRYGDYSIVRLKPDATSTPDY
jgi:hypothetical protein